MDNDKLQTLGIPLTDAYNTLQTFLGGLYVNDFNLFGRVWQVLVQAEQSYRNDPTTCTDSLCAPRKVRWFRYRRWRQWSLRPVRT